MKNKSLLEKEKEIEINSLKEKISKLEKMSLEEYLSSGFEVSKARTIETIYFFHKNGWNSIYCDPGSGKWFATMKPSMGGFVISLTKDQVKQIKESLILKKEE